MAGISANNRLAARSGPQVLSDACSQSACQLHFTCDGPLRSRPQAVCDCACRLTGQQRAAASASRSCAPTVMCAIAVHRDSPLTTSLCVAVYVHMHGVCQHSRLVLLAAKLPSRRATHYSPSGGLLPQLHRDTDQPQLPDIHTQVRYLHARNTSASASG